MLLIVRTVRYFGIIAIAAGAGLIAASTRDWATAIWCGIGASLAVELLLRDRLPRLPACDPCAVCGRHRIGGGVFVAGVGSICFECEERRFGRTFEEAGRD